MKRISKLIFIAFVLTLVFAFFSSGCMVDFSKLAELEKSKSSGSDVSSVSTPNNNDVNASYCIGKSAVTYYTEYNLAHIRVVVPITNDGNVNLYFSNASIDIENSKGGLEDTLSYVDIFPQVLQPGETAYYYQESIYNGVETTGLRAVPHPSVQVATVDCIRYPVTDVNIRDDKLLGMNVVGRVENDTDVKASTVYVVINLFDQSGDMIGRGYTFITDLPANDKLGFELDIISSDNIKASDVAKYQAFAFPMQFQFNLS